LDHLRRRDDNNKDFKIQLDRNQERWVPSSCIDLARLGHRLIFYSLLLMASRDHIYIFKICTHTCLAATCLKIGKLKLWKWIYYSNNQFSLVYRKSICSKFSSHFHAHISNYPFNSFAVIRLSSDENKPVFLIFNSLLYEKHKLLLQRAFYQK